MSEPALEQPVTDAPASAPAAPAASVPAIADQADDTALDLLSGTGTDAADDGDDDGGAPVQVPIAADADRPVWPERPEGLDADDADAVAAWKEQAGLAARDEYEVPELSEGEYTDYGK